MHKRTCVLDYTYTCYVPYASVDSYIEEMHVSRSTHRASYIVHRIADSWDHKRVVRLASDFEGRYSKGPA